MLTITNQSKTVSFQGRLVEVPVSYDNPTAITAAETNSAKQELRRISRNYDHYTQMLRYYNDLRTGLVRHTGVISPWGCLHHEDALVEVIRHIGCWHSWVEERTTLTANPVMGTSTTYRISVCERCDKERTEVLQVNNYAGD